MPESSRGSPAARSTDRGSGRVRYPRAVKGQNFVTPDDAGKRVTFQYELPNGFVGEAVGVLEYFDHGAATYMVRRKDDTLARVPARDVRFGKVVES